MRTPFFGRAVPTFVLLAAFAVGCPSPPPTPSDALSVEPLFTADESAGCYYASPLRITSQGQESILMLDRLGVFRAFDPKTGALNWQASLPAVPEGAGELRALTTPAIVDGLVVVGWQAFRTHHYMGVLDLETRAMALEYPIIELGGSVPSFDGSEEVRFRADKQYMRGIVRHLPRDGEPLGYVYLSLGNAPNSSPHHGWIFEISLDAWKRGEEPVLNRLATTADNDCGPEGSPDPGLCGGGIWNAAGIQFTKDEDGEDVLYFATGNGRTNFNRGSFANTLMRVRPGLDFDPGCDEALCEDYDEINPSEACLASCENVFTPRLMPGEPMLQPEDGGCDGLTFTECYRKLDADLGANAPLLVDLPSGRKVFVQAGKDGALYLVDSERMGVMHQRLQVMDFCGTPDDGCYAFWLGMFVTHPAVTYVDGDPIVILASNMADTTHPSGITAVRVKEDGDDLQMSILWQVPDFDDDFAKDVFRSHPGRPVIYEHDGEAYVFVVETRRGRSTPPPGTLWGVRVSDGELITRIALEDAGQRWSLPLIHDDVMYVGVCDARAGDVPEDERGLLQAFSIAGNP